MQWQWWTRSSRCHNQIIGCYQVKRILVEQLSVLQYLVIVTLEEAAIFVGGPILRAARNRPFSHLQLSRPWFSFVKLRINIKCYKFIWRYRYPLASDILTTVIVMTIIKFFPQITIIQATMYIPRWSCSVWVVSCGFFIWTQHEFT